MRYVTTAGAALLLILAAGACNLDETVYDQTTQGNFKPNASDLGSLIAPAYRALADMYMGWYGNVDVAQEEPADVLVTPERINGWWDGGVYFRQHTHSWTLDSYTFSHTWSNCFSSINNANRVIHQIESDTIPVTNDSLKTGILAELRALRAYDYALLLDNFRNVPIVTDFTAKDLPHQNTGQEVYDFVVSELIATIPNLSAATGVATYGRMNRWAAEAILARVYLNAEVYVGTPAYDKVIPLTQDIIASGKYAIDPSYRIPFSVAAGPLDGGLSQEVIWAVPYDAVYLPVSNFHMKTLKPELKFVFNLVYQPWGGSAGNPQFVDSYDPDDHRKQDTWLMGSHFTSDAQFGYNFTDTIPQFRGPNAFRLGFPVWKYEIYPGETDASDVDYPIVRYAEVLMMQAEALLRTGLADEAALLVTQVRQRAFAATNPAKATVTGAALMQGSGYLYGWYDTDGIVKTGVGGTPVTATTGGAFGGADIQYGRFLDELGWEFAVEGHRRQELIRFGVFSTKAWFNHAADADTHWRVYPIPQFAIDANPNLTQNPGY
jgi:hypothetical protein